jgi:hypothetical protein
MALTKIKTSGIADNAITNAKIADDAVAAAELASDAVVNDSIASGAAVDATKLADGTVTSAELQYINTLSSNVQTQIGTKSPIASPTFTGTPAVPTASASTNTTQVASTAFVRTEVANLVDSAPGSLDTLNELAAALGDDASFSTTVTNSIALKAPIASPTFTGNFTSVGIDDNADATAITIDSSENVGIGVTNPSSFDDEAERLVVGTGSGHQGITIYAGTTSRAKIHFADGASGTDAYRGMVAYNHNNNSLEFATANTNALTLNSSQNATFAGDVSLDKASGDATFIVKSNSGGDPTFVFDSALSSRNGIVYFKDQGTWAGKIIYAHSGDTMKFHTSGSSASSLTLDANATFSGSVSTGGGGTNASDWKLCSKTNAGGTISNQGGAGYFAIGDNYTTASGAILWVRNDGNRGSKGHASGSPLFKASFNDADALVIDKDGDATFTGRVAINDTVSSQNMLVIETTTTDAYTPTDFNNNSVLGLKSVGATNSYSGIQFTNEYGNYEKFFGSVQTGSDTADIVWQGYDRGAGVYKEYMRIAENGKVGIGVSNPDLGQLYVFNDSTTMTAYIQNNQGDGHCLTLKASASDESAAENMFKCATDSASRFEVMNSGKVTVNNSQVHAGASDQRVKKNITTMTNVLDDINKLRGVTFNWRESVESLRWNNPDDIDKQYGMIAQEVEEVWSELVSADDNGIKNISYEPIVAILLQGMKELSAKVTALENA